MTPSKGTRTLARFRSFMCLSPAPGTPCAASGQVLGTISLPLVYLALHIVSCRDKASAEGLTGLDLATGMQAEGGVLNIYRWYYS